MFKCMIGKHDSQKGEKLVRVVVKTREKKYDTNRGTRIGFEIVEEVQACATHSFLKG